MKKLVLVGKWFKDKKSTVIDLQAYRELKRKSKEEGGKNDPVPQGREKEK